MESPGHPEGGGHGHPPAIGGDVVHGVDVDEGLGAGDGGGFPFGVTQDPERNILARNNVTWLVLDPQRPVPDSERFPQPIRASYPPSRAIPELPMPAVGGMPYSSARM